jgi:hypothetical protein
MNSAMNFLPEDYVEKRQAARAAVVFIGLLLVVVGGIIGAYMYTKWQMNAVFDAHDRVTAAFEDASKQIEKARELETQKARMVAKAEITTTLMERVRRSALLGELTRLRPKTINFVTLELKSKEVIPPAGAQLSEAEKNRRIAEGLPLETPKPPVLEVSVDLVATAPTDAEVATYMSALQKSNLLMGVNLLFSEEFRKVARQDAPPEIMRKFHVEMKIDPKADLRPGGATADAAPLKPAVEAGH